MKGMPDVWSDQSVVTTPVDGGGEIGVVNSLTVTLRPRLVFRAIGPACILAGIAGIAAQFLPAIGLLVVGGLAMAAWIPSLAVDGDEIRLRGLWTMTKIPLDTVDQIRLRRVPFGPKHAMRRVYRVGPFCSTPIRLRFLRDDLTLAQITVVYWGGWAGLVRYLLTVPGISADSRTRGRLDRYG